MNKLAVVIGTGLGAAAMYLLDPERGRRRRALLRDRAVRLSHKASGALDVTSKDVTNRMRGMRASARSWFGGSMAPDDVIAERVRSTIGRWSSHPGSIDVKVHNGHVTLGGPILADEVPALVRHVWRVRGVVDVDDRLEPHAEAGNIPGLQGEPSGRRAEGGRFALMQTNWSPAVRLAAGTVGGILTGYGLARRSVAGIALGIGGLLLFTRAATNVELSRLTGVRAARRGIDVQKMMHFNAPVERVYELWSNFENFPQFMAHVLAVRKIAGDLWRWTVTGPMGTPVEFDAEVSAREPNRLLAWRTQVGSPIQHAGIVHFIPNPDGTTTADIKFTYNPAAGAVGYAIARMFGTDPKSQMNEDLMRMKTFLETGRAPHDAAAAMRH